MNLNDARSIRIGELNKQGTEMRMTLNHRLYDRRKLSQITVEIGNVLRYLPVKMFKDINDLHVAVTNNCCSRGSGRKKGI